jgi:site-specific DNA recombinase
MPRPRKCKAGERTQTNSAVIYARVSTKEQSDEGYSIDAQLGLLRSYANRMGLTVLEEFIESETAKVAGRPAFARMMKLIRSEGVRAILVEKTDRLYRNIRDYLTVDELGIEVHLVKEGDIISQDSQSHQKFMHGIRVLIARNYSDNLSEEVKKGMLAKARLGLWPTKAPLGYLNVLEGSRRIITLDPERAELVSWLFKRYADGTVSVMTLLMEANMRGLTTRPGKKLTKNELHILLKNPVYVGLIQWGGEEHLGSHLPLTDQATFNLVQDIMSGRKQTKAKPANEKDFLYKGLFTCGVCGCAISPQSTKGHYYYACTGSKGCPRKTVREEVITEAIAEKLGGMAIRPDVLTILRESLVENEAEEAAYREGELKHLEGKQAELKRNLRDLYVDKVKNEVPQVIYKELKTQWEQELELVEKQIHAFERTRRKYEDECLALVDFASNIYFRFKEANIEEKRNMARNLLSNSTLSNGKVQVSLHKAFEMILEANAQIGEKPTKEGQLVKWLAD